MLFTIKLKGMTDIFQKHSILFLAFVLMDLKVFRKLSNSVLPNTEVQLRIAHQIRNSLRYVGSANKKQFAKRA